MPRENEDRDATQDEDQEVEVYHDITSSGDATFTYTTSYDPIMINVSWDDMRNSLDSLIAELNPVERERADELMRRRAQERYDEQIAELIPPSHRDIMTRQEQEEYVDGIRRERRMRERYDRSRQRRQRIPDFATELPEYKARIDEYFAALESGNIPERPPIDPHFQRYGPGFYDYSGSPLRPYLTEIAQNRTRMMSDFHLYANIDDKWIREFVRWLDGRKCLEINARAGWMAGALRRHGVEVVATDAAPDNYILPQLDQSLHYVEQFSPADAIAEFIDWADVLVTVWPMHLSSQLYQWHGRTVAYIGEYRGGNTGFIHDPLFFDRMFILDDGWERVTNDKYVCWPNVEDRVYVGHVNNTRFRATRRSLAKSFDPDFGALPERTDERRSIFDIDWGTPDDVEDEDVPY